MLTQILRIDEEEFYCHDLINFYDQVQSTLSNILTSRVKTNYENFFSTTELNYFLCENGKNALKVFVEHILNSCEYELCIILNHCTL